jgi:hypothetical protein
LKISSWEEFAMDRREHIVTATINGVEYEKCEECGIFHSHIHMTANSEIICEHCKEDYTHCENCEELYHYDELNHIEENDGYLCDYCW